MTIPKPPPKPVVKNPPKNIDAAALSKFIDGAPDAAPTAVDAPPATRTKRLKMKGHQAQITFALPLELLDKVDNMAESMSISRAAYIKQAISKKIEWDIAISNNIRG
jgi:hypothetical protein